MVDTVSIHRVATLYWKHDGAGSIFADKLGIKVNGEREGKISLLLKILKRKGGK